MNKHAIELAMVQSILARGRFGCFELSQENRAQLEAHCNELRKCIAEGRR